MLQGVPGADWRAFGWTSFELAHLIHGNPDDAGADTLLHLIIPLVEVEMAPDRARIRASTEQRLERTARILARPDPPEREATRLAPPSGDPEPYRAAVARTIDDIRAHRLDKAVLSRVVPVPDAVELELCASHLAGRKANTPARSFLSDLGGWRATGFSPKTVVEALERGNLLAAANSRVVEFVRGIAVVRAFDREGHRLDWFRDAVRDVRDINGRLAVVLVPTALAAMATLNFGVPLTIAALTYSYTGGRIDAGTVLVFLVLVLRVYAPLLQVVGSAEQSRLAEAALRRIGEIRDLPPQPMPPQEVAAVGEPSVELDDVTFGYDAGRPVVQGLSLEVAPHTMTAVVGPSGAGKSTLLALVARFWDVDAGTVRLGGADVRDLTPQQLFDAITVVFQDVYLFQGTIRDNIVFGRPGATDDLVEAAARQAQAHDFITALPRGYDTPVGESGATLSGGERQRISIARAVMKDAPIVLLDEATSALDPINERAVQQAFAELVRARTVIVVAHRLSTIRSADQIVVLDEGRVVERGQHDDLLAADGRYAGLWADRERASQWRLAATEG